MDVERIQKVNALALDLLKQGIAQDRQEAVDLAEKTFRTRDSNDAYNSVKAGMGGSSNSLACDVKPKSEDISQEKIKDILEQNSAFLVKKIKEFQEQMLAMEKEIMTLKGKITYNSIPSAGDILTKEAVKAPQPAVNINEKVPANHPRSGNYKDSDVSIEKFFYMGNK
ncbi:MAG: hypothetical protein AABW48_03175 [Nanoarchaeota archaeon]